MGCDAIFPGGQASTLWQDDELVDLVDEANEELEMQLRLKMKKWGVQTITQATPAFTREGETYNPAVNLLTVAGDQTLSLPPDLGEIVRITCTDQTTVRFVPAEFESQYWIDMMQGSLNSDGTFTSLNTSVGQTYYYDIIAERTLAVTPPFASAQKLSIDYTPMKRPLYWSSAGTVTIVNGTAALTGTNTTWLTDGIFSGASGQNAELLAGFNTLASTSVRLDRDYPIVASIQSDTAATMKVNWAAPSLNNSSFIMAMTPMAPRIYHRWIARLATVKMLSKINPDLSDKYAKQVMSQFTAGIAPTANRRQIQESPVTDTEPLLGGIADF